MYVRDLTPAATRCFPLGKVAEYDLLQQPVTCYFRAGDGALCQLVLLAPCVLPQFAGQGFWAVTVFHTESGEIEGWLVRGDRPVLVTREEGER